MNSKINSIVITSILALAIVSAGISVAFENVLAQQASQNGTQSQGGNAIQGQTGENMTGLTQGQTGTGEDNSDNDEDEENEDGENDEKDDDDDNKNDN